MMAFLDVIVSFDSLPEKKTRVTLAISFRPLPKFLMSSSSMWRLADRAMEMLIFVFYNYFWSIFLISFFLMFSKYFNMLILKINLKNKKNYFNAFLIKTLWKTITILNINYSNLLWINSDIIWVVVRWFFIFNYMIIKINIYKKIWKNKINKKKIYVKTTMIWKWIKKHIFLIKSLIFLFIYLFFVLTMIFFKWKLIIIMETSLN